MRTITHTHPDLPGVTREVPDTRGGLREAANAGWRPLAEQADQPARRRWSPTTRPDPDAEQKEEGD